MAMAVRKERAAKVAVYVKRIDVSGCKSPLIITRERHLIKYPEESTLA